MVLNCFEIRDLKFVFKMTYIAADHIAMQFDFYVDKVFIDNIQWLAHYGWCTI